MLTFIGIRPVEQPYQLVGQVRSLVYFMYYPLHRILERRWDVLIGYLQFSGKVECGEISAGGRYFGGELKWKDLSGSE